MSIEDTYLDKYEKKFIDFLSILCDVDDRVDDILDVRKRIRQYDVVYTLSSCGRELRLYKIVIRSIIKMCYKLVYPYIERDIYRYREKKGLISYLRLNKKCSEIEKNLVDKIVGFNDKKYTILRYYDHYRLFKKKVTQISHIARYIERFFGNEFISSGYYFSIVMKRDKFKLSIDMDVDIEIGYIEKENRTLHKDVMTEHILDDGSIVYNIFVCSIEQIGKYIWNKLVDDKLVGSLPK